MTHWWLTTDQPQDNHETQTSISYPCDLPDLSNITYKTALKQLLAKHHPDTPPETIERIATPLWTFLDGPKLEDIVMVQNQGDETLHFYEVTGPYRYQANAPELQHHTIPAKQLREPIPTSKFSVLEKVTTSNTPFQEISNQQLMKEIQGLFTTPKARRRRILAYVLAGLLFFNLMRLMMGTIRDLGWFS